MKVGQKSRENTARSQSHVMISLQNRLFNIFDSERFWPAKILDNMLCLARQIIQLFVKTCDIGLSFVQYGNKFNVACIGLLRMNAVHQKRCYSYNTVL